MSLDNLDPQRPRYSTPRDPGARTDGAGVGAVAAALGTPLMPWQQHVVDVALERDPRDPRRWRYPLVVVTVPRQAGKTTLVGATMVHRAITRGRGRMFMTAQKGKDARARWRDVRDRLIASPLAAHLPPALNGAGTEALRFPGGAAVLPFAPTHDALHGETPPLVVIDEAWSFDAARGEDLMQAIRPAQITLPDRQLWVLSTAGTAESAFLRDLVDTGRLAVDDTASGMAYFEWSPHDDDADAYDPATWSFHPALGHTIELSDLAHEAESTTRGNFERAYLNRWTVSSETIVDVDRFDALHNEAQVQPDSLVLAYAVAQDRSRASIYAGWVDDDGRVQVRTVIVKAGASWLVSEIPRLVAQLRPRDTIADDGGPSRQVTDAIERAGTPITKLGFREFATACGAFLASIVDGELGHDGSPAMRESLISARLKFVGDQRAYDRRRSAGPIDAIEAPTLAAWGATHAPAPTPRPYVYVREGR